MQISVWYMFNYKNSTVQPTQPFFKDKNKTDLDVTTLQPMARF